LLVDDMMRLVSAADIAAAHDRQIHVIGLSDSAQGQGRAYLEELGVDQVIAVSTPPAEIAEMIRGWRPRFGVKASGRRLLIGDVTRRV
jgi:hypothetical protein